MKRIDCFFSRTKKGAFIGGWWFSILWIISMIGVLVEDGIESFLDMGGFLIVMLILFFAPLIFMISVTVDAYNKYLISKIGFGIFDVDKKWPEDCLYEGFIKGNAENSDERQKQFFLLEETMCGYGYRGLEKSKIMLERKIKYTKINMSELNLDVARNRNTFLKKEHNWATWGGIANGLAGPVAGIMTALETEAENVKVREHNAVYGPIVNFLNNNIYASINEEKSKLKKYDVMKTNLHQNVKILDEDTEKLFEKVEIGNITAIEYTDSAMIVSADFEVEKLLKEYKNASLDGAIRAKIYQNKTLVGSAYFVLPVEGISNKTNLCAVCTKGNFAKDCEIILEPVDLWVMTK